MESILERLSKSFKKKLIVKMFLAKFFILISAIFLLKKTNFLYHNSEMSNHFPISIRNLNENKKINLGVHLKTVTNSEINFNYYLLNFESKLKFLSEINKRRIFERRYPLPEEIKCFQHIREGGLKDMLAFLSFLTENTTFFEFGSGCTSVIAKHYAKKSYAVEGNKNWYEEGIKNGLKDNLIFKDIKAIPKGNLWSEPGKDSNVEDWKNYFQAYKEEYNADVIFIDGRFRVACAFDIFNKIRNDTLILIHEYFRDSYLAIPEYYDYIYHWDRLYLFKKKSNIKEIPIDVQKKYWSVSA